MTETLRVFRLDPRAQLPARVNDYAVGLDVFAFLLTETGRETSRAIHQRGTTVIPTGLVLQPPAGSYVQIHSRSGLARRGIFVANSPGIVDPDYSGELVILLFNGSYETHYVAHGHRIAQLIVAPLPECSAVTELIRPPVPFGRGASGFGSTGL